MNRGRGKILLGLGKERGDIWKQKSARGSIMTFAYHYLLCIYMLWHVQYELHCCFLSPVICLPLYSICYVYVCCGMYSISYTAVSWRLDSKNSCTSNTSLCRSDTIHDYKVQLKRTAHLQKTYVEVQKQLFSRA